MKTHEVADLDDSKPKEKKSENLDDAGSAENKKFEKKFKTDYASRLNGGKMVMKAKNGSVDYKYEITVNESGTMTIKKTNLSEQKEKGSGVDSSRSETVTYARFYAGKVIGFPEIRRVIDEDSRGGGERRSAARGETPSMPADTGADKPKKKSDSHDDHPTYELEVGVMVPRSKTKAAGGSVEDSEDYGAEVVGRYVLTGSPVGHLSLMVPLQYEWGGKTTVSRDGALKVEDSTYWAASAGVGLEAGWKPVRPVTLFVGAGLRGTVHYVDTTRVQVGGRAPLMDGGTHTEFLPGAFVTAGVKVNPVGRWFISGSVEPSVNFTPGSGVKAPFFIGTGMEF